MERTSVARAVQRSVYLLTALASCLAAIGEASLFPGLATLPVAVAGYIFNERRGTMRLPLLWINILALVAFAASAVEFVEGHVELRVLSVLHLLVYLSWIVMFVHRPPRHYWWLCGLGVLQVAFGAVLTGSGWFGLLLILYIPLGLWTLCLFTIYQGELQAQPTAVVATRGGVRPSIQFDGRRSWLTGRFVLNVSLLVGAGVVLGGAMFLFVPRVWAEGGGNSLRSNSDETITGFTEEVRLGEIGDILANARRVLQVRFFDNDTNKPLEVAAIANAWGEEEPLFRGMVLDTYFDGRWTGPGNSRLRHLTQRVVPGMIRQEYTQEEIGSQVLFGMRPVLGGRTRQGQQPLEINPENGTLTSPRSSRGGTQEYLIYSMHPEKAPGAISQDLPPITYRFAQRYNFVPSGLDRLGALSAQVVSPDSLQRQKGSPQRKVALALVEYLRDSGEFGYTLKQQVHDPSIDPVEDFLFNRREGHCEYFASALALLLRTRGISSRVITGFKGGRLNELTNSWEVQQRHAHSWVEAFLDGTWVTLDAVPSGRLQSLAQFDRTPAAWQNVRSMSSAVWDKYVMRLDGNVQQEWFYDPLQRQIGNSFQSLRSSPRQVRSIRRAIVNFFTSPREWLSWRGGLVATLMILAGWGLVKLARHLRISLKGLFHWMRGTVAGGPTRIDFYERFRKLAEARGMRRRPGQTPREFISETQDSWKKLPAQSRFEELPPVLPESFYLERFGGQHVPPDERAALMAALDRLELWLKKSPRLRSGNGLAEGQVVP